MTEEDHGNRSGDHNNGNDLDTSGAHRRRVRERIEEARSSAAAQLRWADDYELEVFGEREEERARERRRRFRLIRGGGMVAAIAAGLAWLLHGRHHTMVALAGTAALATVAAVVALNSSNDDHRRRGTAPRTVRPTATAPATSKSKPHPTTGRPATGIRPGQVGAGHPGPDAPPAPGNRPTSKPGHRAQPPPAPAPTPPRPSTSPTPPPATPAPPGRERCTVEVNLPPLARTTLLCQRP